MSEEIIIREVSEDDYYKKHLELYKESYAIEPKAINIIDYKKYIKEQIDKNNHIFVMETDNTIIGSATCFIETKLIHNFGKVAHIEDVIISQNNQGKGLGKNLIEYCIQFAKKNKFYKIILDCNDNNVIFYEKCNFERKGNMMAKYFD